MGIVNQIKQDVDETDPSHSRDHLEIFCNYVRNRTVKLLRPIHTWHLRLRFSLIFAILFLNMQTLKYEHHQLLPKDPFLTLDKRKAKKATKTTTSKKTAFSNLTW